MAQDFHTRLYDYYEKVAKVLRGEADVASVFPNPSDVGGVREKVYANFLCQHAPSKCNVFLGGFLFHANGSESKQMDVIVTTDTTPRFNFYNPNGGGKAFAPVEGTLGVASIKSTLDKAKLFNALTGIASIPPTTSIEGRISITLKLSDYDDWPYKILYASKGLESSTLLDHLDTFYTEHSNVPLNRRPHLIHVAGKYVLLRGVKGLSIVSTAQGRDKESEIGKFHLFTRNPDLQGIIGALNGLQQNATASTHIMYSYCEVFNNMWEAIVAKQ